MKKAKPETISIKTIGLAHEIWKRIQPDKYTEFTNEEGNSLEQNISEITNWEEIPASSLLAYLQNPTNLNYLMLKKDKLETVKVLGKIKSAEFGKNEYLFGLNLVFTLGNSSECGFSKEGFYNPTYAHYEDGQKERNVLAMVDYIRELVSAAKVDYVSELVGKPVEVYFEDNTCVGFRILTEVI
ncbi:hypothetical protein EP56_05685 [Listeriaceae bacterium FSL A5-0209]|nr:hypothetical protein EP56_05685 [Listeriaceae bacterium FSL A5-0209]